MMGCWGSLASDSFSVSAEQVFFSSAEYPIFTPFLQPNSGHFWPVESPVFARDFAEQMLRTTRDNQPWNRISLHPSVVARREGWRLICWQTSLFTCLRIQLHLKLLCPRLPFFVSLLRDFSGYAFLQSREPHFDSCYVGSRACEMPQQHFGKLFRIGFTHGWKLLSSRQGEKPRCNDQA